MLILDEILDKGKIAIKYLIGNWCNWNSNWRVDNSVRSMLSFLNLMIILWLCNKIHLLLGNTNLSIKGQVCLQYTFKWFWKIILYTHTHIHTDIHTHTHGSPDISDDKASACQWRRPTFDPWGGKIPWKRKWQPTPVFLPGKSHGQRSLVGYCPWGRKESDTTEQLTNMERDRTYAANRLKGM